MSPAVLRNKRRRQIGVSLIEAVVAMAVMAFGMLGVVGLQASLRSNADVSKQRSEAVRIAQAQIERDRSFSVLPSAPLAGRFAYDDVVTAAAADVTPADSNATFTVTKTVVAFPAVGDETRVAAHKNVGVRVAWSDRNGEVQFLRMGTLVSATAPEIGAALSAPGIGSVAQTVKGRHPAVPYNAVDLGNGTSTFTPPGAGAGVGWTFNNSTGFITRICNPACTDVNARLLSGFVRFATGIVQPEAPQAEVPPSASLPGVGVSVTTTVPAGATGCFTDSVSDATAVAYYCAMLLDIDTSLAVGNPLRNVPIWTGQSRVSIAMPAGGFDALAANIADASNVHYRICRYTTTRGQTVVPVPLGTNPAIRNQDHPFNYVRADAALLAQNFLVIRAGDGLAPFTCPADDAVTTPDVFSNTWHHQPGA